MTTFAVFLCALSRYETLKATQLINAFSILKVCSCGKKLPIIMLYTCIFPKSYLAQTSAIFTDEGQGAFTGGGVKNGASFDTG